MCLSKNSFILNMDNKRSIVVANYSKNLAGDYIKLNNFGRAFSHLLIALKLEPAFRAEFKETLSTVLCRFHFGELVKWGITLESNKKYDELFKCYELALEVFPENEYILNNLGELLLRHGLLKEATHYFHTSLSVKPGSLVVLRNLENVSNLAVQRWHFRMLNDTKRNGAFYKAIKKKLKEGFDTILDIGTGTGILSLFAMEAGAKNIISCDSSPVMIEMAHQVLKKNNAHTIKLVNKHSFDMKVPDDMRERVKLVITEIMDCGLLGEHILETLIDAWDRLLLPPSSDSNLSGAVIPFGATIFIAGIECETVRKKNAFTDSANKFFNFEYCTVKCSEENYDSECLRRIRNGFKILTNVHETFFINFNDPNSMKSILSGESNGIIELECLENGTLDCLAVWFDLYVDENIVLNTAPNSNSCDSWDQAIFPVPNNIHVRKGEKINVEMFLSDGKLIFDNFTLIPQFELKGNIFGKIKHVFRPSEELLQTLNSSIYADSFFELYQKIGKNLTGDVSILDAFPFPFFGLNVLIHNRNEKKFLTAVVRDENDRNFLGFVANKFDLGDKLRFIEEHELFGLDEKGKYDVILLNFIERRGELKDKMIRQLEDVRSRLKSGGLLIPEKVTIMGQMIESEWLEKESKIINDNVTFGYKIGEILNSYQVSTHIDFDLNGISKNCRSEPFELCNASTGQFKHDVSIPLIENGFANALALWFHIYLLNDGPEISTLHDGITNQSALLFPKILGTKCMELKIIYDNGLLKIENLI